MEKTGILIDEDDVKEFYSDLVAQQPTDEEWIVIHNNFLALAAIIAETNGYQLSDMPYIVTEEHTVH